MLKRNEPASTASINFLLNSRSLQFPKDYLEFLAYSDGAAGTFPNGNHVILWPIDRLIERNKADAAEDLAPGIFIFGSSGGGEAYGFDSRNSMGVIQIPFVGMELSAVEYLASSFTESTITLGGANCNGVTMPLPEKAGEREALEHERVELEDALVAVVGEMQRDKLRRIIAEQMPQGAEPNTTEQREEMIRRVLAAFEGTLIQ